MYPPGWDSPAWMGSNPLCGVLSKGYLRRPNPKRNVRRPPHAFRDGFARHALRDAFTLYCCNTPCSHDPGPDPQGHPTRREQKAPVLATF